MMAIQATVGSPILSLGPDGKLRLTCSFLEKDVAKTVRGYRWNNEAKTWDYDFNLVTYNALKTAFPRLVVTPNLQRLIAEMEDQLEAVNAVKTAGWENAEPLAPMPLKTKPFKHQIAAYNIGIQIPYFAALMEQGTGKSLTAVAITGRRYLDGQIKKVLVIAPASVVPVWPREFAVHGDFKTEVFALEGPVSKRIAFVEALKEKDALLVLVTNYEAVWRMDETLLKWKPDLIICDEAQRIKTPSARQSKAIHKLGKDAKYRMILTGTPITQSPLDFYSQYKFLDPRIFGSSFANFKARYAVEINMGSYNRIAGYKNLPELVQKAHSIAFRCTKAECLDLPETIDQVLYCELEPAARKIYEQMTKESVAELANETTVTAANVLAKLLRLSQLAGGFIGTETDEILPVSDAKLKLLSETVDDLLEAGKKVVVFARFLPEIEAIKEILFKKKVGFQCITGSVPLPVRGVAVEQFQTQPEIKVFVAQIQCAGLGITLTAADTAIFYSLDYSFANYDQCRARIHRIGQRNACTYIHLVAKKTVDEKVMKALQNKRDVAEDVVDNWRKYLGKGDE